LSSWQVFWLADQALGRAFPPPMGAVAFSGVGFRSQRRSNAADFHRIPFSPPEMNSGTRKIGTVYIVSD
jgi:hypothetical protein